jgi:hypothetical protein
MTIPHVELLDRAAILAALRRQEGHPDEADVLLELVREVRRWRERALVQQDTSRFFKRIRLAQRRTKA